MSEDTGARPDVVSFSDPHHLSDTPRAGIKRKRTTRACNQCRSRKHRCDGERPACLPCISMGTACTYGSEVRKRGLPTGYVKSLELLLGLIFTVVPNGERTVHDLLAAAELVLEQGGKLSLSSRHVQSPEVPRIAWAQSRVLADLERRLGCLESGRGDEENAVPDRDENEVGNRDDHFMARTGLHDSANTPIPAFDDIQMSPGHRPDYDHWRSPVINNTAPPALQQTGGGEETAHLQFPATSRSLLDTYFSYTHCWIPILEKHKLFQLLYSAPQVDTLDSHGDLATFWAILAYSSLQTTQEQPSSSASGDGGDGGDGGGRLSSPEYYEQARRLIPAEDGGAQAGHAQALTIMALLQMRRGHPWTAWGLIGQAVRIILGPQAAQPQHDNGDTVTTTHLKSLGSPVQDRLLLACFALDTFLSACLQRPPHLRASDIQSFGPLEETGPDEWDPWVSGRSGSHCPEPSRAISTFNRWVHVARVLNRAIWGDSPYWIDVTSRRRHVTEIHLCRDRLPPHCLLQLPARESVVTQDTPTTPQLINLHLALASVENCLGSRRHMASRVPSCSLERLHPYSTNELFRETEKMYGRWALPPIFACYEELGKPERAVAIPPISTDSPSPWPPQQENSVAPITAERSAAVSVSPYPTSGRVADELRGCTPSSIQNMDHTFGPTQGADTASSHDQDILDWPWIPDFVTQFGAYPIEQVSGGPGNDSNTMETGSADYSYLGDASVLDNAEWMTEESTEFMRNLGFAT